MKVCFDTFGCRLNRAEALSMEAGFLARGWKVASSHAEADLIIVRGCSVTAKAQHECERLLEHLKEKYPAKRVIATGCLKQKRNEALLRDLDMDRIPLSTTRVFLKVQDGCSSNCAFCIVPQFRGTARSVVFEDVLEQAKRFFDAGYTEIVVTGCNLSQYNSKGRRIAQLAAALAALDGRRRIRIGSVEPGPAAAELVDAMAANANICRYLHLPVQSGSNTVLSAMRRPYKVQDVEEIVDAARKAMPFVAIGCDLMAGFPGESEHDALATRSLTMRLAIARAHVFPFSERPGTAAALMAGKILPALRAERAAALQRIADEERTRYAKRMIGRVVEIVVEDEENVAGWTGEYLWCRLRHEYAAAIGAKRRDLVKIRVQKAEGHVLAGTPVFE